MKRADHLPAEHCSNTKTTKPSCLSTSGFHLLPEMRAAILCRLIKTLPCFLLSLLLYTGCFSQGSPFPNPSSPWFDWNHPVFLAYRDSVGGVHAWQNGSYRNIKIIVSDSQSRMFYAFTRFGDLYDSARVSQEL